MVDDSRDASADSRFIGPVPREKIVGRVPRVILSFDPSRHFLPRPQRILQPMNLGGA
jgi:signal peptidase I